ncbi:MAG: hypothetical protein JO138_02795 [Acidobacteriaceae bacterium]|nr:hypothetical protein [Acidobacteriaceae bacterium]
MPRFFRSDGQILPNPVGVEQVELVCLAAAKPYDKPPVQIAYNFMLWSWHPNFPNRINQVVMVIAVNRDGQVCDLEPNAARDHYRYASGATDHWPNEQPHPLESLPSEYTSTLPSLLYPVLLATSLCNDLRAKVERIATPPKLMRQQVRRHGWAPECWHDIRMNAGSSQ